MKGLIILFIYLCFQNVDGQDPCTDSGTATLYRSVFDIPFCDASLPPIWYKIDEKAGDDIYTECVSFGTCGTVYPLWMDGTIPTEAEGIVDRKVCEVVPGNCCNKTYEIKVKNCGDFRVYKLMYTQGCHKAYCIKASEEVTDCDGQKGNFKCGDGNSKVLIAISLVVVFVVIIVGTLVWCYLRRQPGNVKKPILSDVKRSNSEQPIVHINDPAPTYMNESNF